jgi:hypothetical protein
MTDKCGSMKINSAMVAKPLITDDSVLAVHLVHDAIRSRPQDLVDIAAQPRMLCSRKSFLKKSVIFDSAPAPTSSFAPNR